VSVEPIRPFTKPKSLLEVADILQNHETRLTTVEETYEVIDKVWRFLKVMTPALIGALLASLNPDSFLFRALSALMKALNQ